MWNKPFKPPARKLAPPPPPPPAHAVERILDTPSPPPPAKRRRVVHVIEDDDEDDEDGVGEDGNRGTAVALSNAANRPRTPLLTVRNPPPLEVELESGGGVPESYWLVLWRKFTTKKHKTWDGDGVLSVRAGYARLQDISGRELGRCAWKEPLLAGSCLSIAGKEVEIDTVISREDFLAGRPFLNLKMVGVGQKTGSLEEGMMTKVSVKRVRSMDEGRDSDAKKVEAGRKAIDELATMTPKSFYNPAPRSAAVTSHFKTPVIRSTIMAQSKSGTPTPRHNPNAPGALVMMRPKDCPKGKQIVDVVLDPLLANKIRPHQREGVKFLYECVMGMRSFNGQGALLADEMGLGKTFQTIALLWTLLKQNPIADSGPVIKKALVVCPVTLIQNWRKEFKRWLGNENIGVLVAEQNTRLTDFTHGKSYSVMIIGYEKLRSVQDELKRGAEIDIIVADEGHRLKTAQNKSAQAIRSLNTDRRIVLTGTPMQNDLSEFFVMVDFVNPGLLSTYNTFKKEFEGPIMKSRQPGASAKDKEKGEARQEELAALTKEFILRRTGEVQAKFLPPKTEYVLFCKPTTAQAEIYQHILECPVFGKVLGSPEASLQLITILKKVCNSPTLLSRTDPKAVPSNTNVADLLASIPPHLSRMNYLASSSKIRVLDKMLSALSENTREKVVLVSNYTSTLDLLAQHLTSVSLPFLRLDGSTPTAKRQDLVDQFNRSDASTHFAFLLSAKSGGTGINLVGASRLVLFDVDWNPATDLQAMARIHRPGQKRPVKIYRMLMAGGMDEKIYQRQITKMGLADSVVDGKKNDASFSPEELRDLFRLDLTEGCQTHELLGCACGGKPTELVIKAVASPDPEAFLVNDSEPEDVDSDDELLFPSNPALVSASKYDWRATERKHAEELLAQRQKEAKGKMQALMEYTHIDTSVFHNGLATDVFGLEMEEVTHLKKIIDDEVLVSILEQKSCKVGFVFAKRARTE